MQHLFTLFFFGLYLAYLWCNTGIAGKIIVLTLVVKCIVKLSQKPPVSTPNVRHIKRTMAKGQYSENLADLCPGSWQVASKPWNFLSYRKVSLLFTVGPDGLTG